jgi:2-keto-3-deoxy-L-rhamnonate aldolase RhmA
MEKTEKPSEKTNIGEESSKPAVTNFIRNIIDRDLESGKHPGIVTRFPRNQMDTYTSVMPNRFA